MSYFNPEIYNYESLRPEDQKRLDFYDKAVEDALNGERIIIYDRANLVYRKTKKL